MTRRQQIRACLLKSLSKRWGWIVVPAVGLGLVANLLGLSGLLCVAVALAMVLVVAANIAQSSYQRHQDEFDIPAFVIKESPRFSDS